MQSSQFSDIQSHIESLEPIDTSGATCDTFLVKLYGKLHFLKRLKAEYVGDVRYQEAQRKEYETGYRLEHPNLVRYISLADDGILMEYVDGDTLADRLAKHPEYFTKQNTEKFLRQLLDAVGYLHSHQVLHLDLKPDNILLTRINDDLKLTDLGCCYTDTFADTQGCTKAFAAPEQLKGASVDERTDIYAIGKILELLPHHHKYNKVIARCTAEEPSNRYQSVEQIMQSITPHRRFSLSIVVILLLIIIACAIYFISAWRVAPVVPETPAANPEKADSIIKVTEQPSASPTNNEPPIVSPTNSEPAVISPVTSEPQPSVQVSEKEVDSSQMEAELDKQIDKAYKATIATFCDSVFPSPTAGKHWQKQSSEFHAQVLESAAIIARKYRSIPESIIMQHVESRYYSLTTFIFNEMRENGKKKSEE